MSPRSLQPPKQTTARPPRRLFRAASFCPSNPPRSLERTPDASARSSERPSAPHATRGDGRRRSVSVLHHSFHASTPAPDPDGPPPLVDRPDDFDIPYCTDYGTPAFVAAAQANLTRLLQTCRRSSKTRATADSVRPFSLDDDPKLTAALRRRHAVHRRPSFRRDRYAPRALAFLTCRSVPYADDMPLLVDFPPFSMSAPDGTRLPTPPPAPS